MSGPVRRYPLKHELLDAINVAEKSLIKMVGRTRNGIPAKIRDEIALIADPLFTLLRRAGLRNGMPK